MTVTALGELLIDFAPKQADEDGRPMFAPWRPSWARRRRLWER